jgi:hexokinase
MAPANKFQLMLAEDGSGKGAGLIAAIASRLKKQQAH